MFGVFWPILLWRVPSKTVKVSNFYAITKILDS